MQKSYDLLTVKDAEGMSLFQWSELPLSVMERICSEYLERPVKLSDTPHGDTGYTRGKTCPAGHFYSAHGKRYNGDLVCLACRREKQRASRMK